MSKVKLDPHGWPDYTYPMTIIGQELNVAIDIAAQTLPTLDVNLAASAITVNVALQSSAVTLNVNVESISAGVVFNVAQSGTWTINAAQTGTWTINIGAPLDASGNLQTAVVSSVQLDVNIAASAVTLDVNLASSAVTLNVKITSSTVTLNVSIANIATGVVFNVAQSGSWTINAAQTGAWSVNVESVSAGVTFNVNITDCAVTFDVNIASVGAVTFNVAITDASGVTFNVNVTDAVTLNVNITGATTLNVKLTDSTATVNVNFTGQTSNVNIDLKAQSIAVKGLTDWAAENATDIDVTGGGFYDSGSLNSAVTYTVPSGKTLLIYNWSVALTDADGQVYGFLNDYTANVTVDVAGGTRGFSVPLNKPIRIAADHVVKVIVRQDTGAGCTVLAHIGGVLV